MKDKKKNSNKKKLSDFVKPYRIESGKGFRLKDFDPADTHGLGEQFKSQAAELTRQGIEKLSDLQDKLSSLQARFAALGDTWQDDEHTKFAEEFRQTMKALKKFIEVSNQHTPYLLRKAQRIEEYLNQR